MSRTVTAAMYKAGSAGEVPDSHQLLLMILEADDRSDKCCKEETVAQSHSGSFERAASGHTAAHEGSVLDCRGYVPNSPGEMSKGERMTADRQRGNQCGHNFESGRESHQVSNCKHFFTFHRRYPVLVCTLLDSTSAHPRQSGNSGPWLKIDCVACASRTRLCLCHRLLPRPQEQGSVALLSFIPSFTSSLLPHLRFLSSTFTASSPCLKEP